MNGKMWMGNKNIQLSDPGVIISSMLRDSPQDSYIHRTVLLSDSTVQQGDFVDKSWLIFCILLKT